MFEDHSWSIIRIKRVMRTSVSGLSGAQMWVLVLARCCFGLRLQEEFCLFISCLLIPDCGMSSVRPCRPPTPARRPLSPFTASLT